MNAIYSSTFAALDTAASSATSPDLLVPASEAAGVASFASIVAWGTVATSCSGTTLAEDAVSRARATGASALGVSTRTMAACLEETAVQLPPTSSSATLCPAAF